MSLDNPSPTTPLDQSRLIQDKKGRFMYLGDSANPAFLQSIRRLVRETQGSCAFVDDPLRPCMVEASPEGAPTWLDAGSELQPVPELSEQDAKHFASQYHLATNGIIDLFDKSVLLEQLPLAVSKNAIALPLAKPVVYLILAIGAQASPKDLGQVAESCFNYGRYLSARYLMDDPSILAVEAYILITMYLLAASRRNAAFMHLGFAVRAAYALGLHLKAVSLRFPTEESNRRERIWRSLRSMDILTSALLGRPPSTKETRDTRADEDYSACSDLLAVFEDVLVNVYEARQISADTLNRVAARQREWAATFARGLALDNIETSDELEGGQLPNTGLTHIKVVFHWTVMLLTRPFLSERVAAHARQTACVVQKTASSWTPAESSRVLAHACVNSAVRTLALLETLIDHWDAPKRLPFAVSCTVHSALVLGLAHFGDMHLIFPLDKYMHAARRILQRFSNDAIASRNTNIIQYLHEACMAYSEKRHAASMAIEGQLISNLFGQLHHNPQQGESPFQLPDKPTGDASGDQAYNSSLIDKAFGGNDAPDSWDTTPTVAGGDSVGASQVQPLSPSSIPAARTGQEMDAEAALEIGSPKALDNDNLFGMSDIVNLESQDELVSLYALIDTSGGYLGFD